MRVTSWAWLPVGVALMVGCADSTKSSSATAAAGAKGQAGAKASAPDDGYQSKLAKDDQEKVVARVGDIQISLLDVERRLNQQAPYARARYTSLERKKEFLDNLVRFEVLAMEAARKGYDRDPEVIQQMKQTMVRKLMAREVQSLVKLADIGDAEMQTYYEKEKDSYHKPEQVRVSRILLSDEAKAKAVHKELEKAIGADRRNYRKIFSEHARKFSQDEGSKARGGDLRFFARSEEGGSQPRPISDAAFGLNKVGDLSAPVETPAGWSVLLLTGRKNRYDRSFDQVKRQIQNRLYREKKRKRTDGYIDDLKSAAKVEINGELLEKIKMEFNTAAARPPGAPRAGSVLGPVDPASPPTLPGRSPRLRITPPPVPKPAQK